MSVASILQCCCEHPHSSCTVTSFLNPKDLLSQSERIICETCYNEDAEILHRIKLLDYPLIKEVICGICRCGPSSYIEELKMGLCEKCRNERIPVGYRGVQGVEKIPEFEEAGDTIVENQIYLGSVLSTANRRILKIMGITAILNCADVLPEYYAEDAELQIRYHRLPIADSVDEDLLIYLPSAMAFIEECLGQGRKVLVHCRAGKLTFNLTMACTILKY
jgi:hypothetical protein